MNHPSQRIAHALAGGIELLDPEVIHTLEGHSAICPTAGCGWTSGMREFRSTVKVLYDKHLEYVRNLPSE